MVKRLLLFSSLVVGLLAGQPVQPFAVVLDSGQWCVRNTGVKNIVGFAYSTAGDQPFMLDLVFRPILPGAESAVSPKDEPITLPLVMLEGGEVIGSAIAGDGETDLGPFTLDRWRRSLRETRRWLRVLGERRLKQEASLDFPLRVGDADSIARSQAAIQIKAILAGSEVLGEPGQYKTVRETLLTMERQLKSALGGAK